MKRCYPAIVLLLILSSCGYFETEKISSETFYQSEKAAINWEEVDQYPQFSSCPADAEKQQQIACFQKILASSILDAADTDTWKTTQALSDTVALRIQINEAGSLQLLHIIMDSVVSQQLPSLRSSLERAMSSVQSPSPAYKRGIPVTTEFTLPVVIHTRIKD